MSTKFLNNYNYFNFPIPLLLHYEVQRKKISRYQKEICSVCDIIIFNVQEFNYIPRGRSNSEQGVTLFNQKVTKPFTNIMKNSNSENVGNSVNHNDDDFKNLDGSQEYYAGENVRAHKNITLPIKSI